MRLSEFMNDDGFTYIEVVTALFIFSLIGFLLWSGFSTALTTVDKMKYRVRTANEIASLEYEFRKSVNSLVTDYWEIGRNEDLFLFLQEEDRMVFTDNTESFYYNNLIFNSLVYRDNCAVLTVETESGEEKIISALWGSYHFGESP